LKPRSICSPAEFAHTNSSSQSFGIHTQQIAANTPPVVDSAYFLNPSGAPATTYLPTATDDSYYSYFGDMTGCDVGAIPSPSLAPSETTHGDHETKNEMPLDSQKEEMSGRKKTSVRIVDTETFHIQDTKLTLA
jgi:hypothetical protein